MNLRVRWETATETSRERMAWFEDRKARAEYMATWVPGLGLPPRICPIGGELPKGVNPADLLLAMDVALAKGGYRGFA